MLALNPESSNSSQSSRLTPNILPCRIHHDGPVEAPKRYWDPVFDDGKSDLATSYFRGRKLRGRRVPIPQGYHGLIATPTNTPLPTHPSLSSQTPSSTTHQEQIYEQQDGEEEEEDVKEPPPSLVEKTGTFSEFMVWEHEDVPAADDPFVKGVSEWIQFAEAMHLDPADTHTPENLATKNGEKEKNDK
ncbi:hypothetical protein AJ80_01430 [Polytolypa hystricis UAMH7299]|uniref:Uncharacterized protein n=1 Tax=Polytolypa hystricis (strain UAMH7299) TaxID=1447883 RepID=A0A2B7Z0T6_POLH7|nr:hypothetical protein AJ80_01430 [Polytolypa hystricis UAMH7299]